LQLNLGFALIGTSLLIGGACAVAIYVGAESIFGIYTSDPETLKLLLPTRIICIPYIICSLCNSVTDGMVIAAQEFRAQALVYISAMVFVYLPFVIVVKEAESLKITLTTVYLAKLCFELTKLFGLGYLAKVQIGCTDSRLSTDSSSTGARLCRLEVPGKVSSWYRVWCLWF